MAGDTREPTPHEAAMRPVLDTATLTHPIKLLLVTAFAVFAGEVVVMFVLAIVPPIPVAVEALLDGVMITVLATPFLYLFLFRPLVREIGERWTAEAAMRQLNQELERRVESRTADLAQANQLLTGEVDERRQAQHQLLKTNDFVKRMLESAPCLLMVYDADSMVCSYTNSAIAELLGYTPEQVQLAEGRFLSRITSQEGYRRLTELTRQLVTGDEDLIRTCFELRDVKLQSGTFRVRLQVFSRTREGTPKDILLAAINTAGEH